MNIKTQIKMVLTMNDRQLNRAADRAAMMCGLTCPECNSADTESNGYTEFRCDACDHRWGCEGGEWYGIKVAA
jgi:transposase-like protein